MSVKLPPEKQNLDHTVYIIQELAERRKYTPDYPEMIKYENILVFVYNDFKRNYPLNMILNESRYLGEGRTCSDGYVMKNPKWPLVFLNHSQKANNRCFIKGEVYAVPPETLLKLDKIHMNGYHTFREKRNVFLNEQSFTTSQGKKIPSASVQMWIANDEFWERDSLQQLAIHMPKDKRNQKVQYYMNLHKMHNQTDTVFRKTVWDAMQSPSLNNGMGTAIFDENGRVRKHMGMPLDMEEYQENGFSGNPGPWDHWGPNGVIGPPFDSRSIH